LQEGTYNLFNHVKAFNIQELWQNILIYFLLGYIISRIPDACHHASNSCTNSSRTSDGISINAQPTERSYEIEAHGESYSQNQEQLA
jgi:hypothetical protein